MRTLVCLLTLLAACQSARVPSVSQREQLPLSIEVEAGPLWQSRNDVRIPGEGGTRFPLDELQGSGPFAAGRLTADWDANERHAVRAVVAPLEFAGTGTLSAPTQFAGADFDPGVATRGTYQFSSYRIGYRYTFLRDDEWRLRVGGTLFVRDAKIELVQGATRASDADVGLVPLLNFSADYFPARNWRIATELDGLASPQGRAADFSLKAHYDLSDRYSLGIGYRTIEGGADNDDVFSFAWLQSLVATVTIRL